MAKQTIIPAERVIYKPLSTLKLWGLNFNEGDVGAIALSIERFGFNSVIRLWQNDTIIAGNHSAMALMSLKARGPVKAHQDGLLPWPPKNIIEQGGEWLVACIDLSYLDELEAKAYAIADNDIARKAVQDLQKKAEYLVEIQQKRPDALPATGMNAGDLDQLLAQLAYSDGGRPEGFFDATGLPDATQVGDMSGRAYMLYVSFPDEESATAALAYFTAGRRKGFGAGERYASLIGPEVMQIIQAPQRNEGEDDGA